MKAPNAKPGLHGNQGFTFIEVLVAMLIFTFAALAAVEIARGSVRANLDSKTISQATWLVQGLMADLETRLDTEGIDKACEEKASGKFDAPFDRFSWKSFCYPIDFRISETAARMAQAQAKGEDPSSVQENPVLKMILDTASSYLTQSMREVHVEVHWMDGKNPRSVSLTTHVARYDVPLAIGGAAPIGPGGKN